MASGTWRKGCCSFPRLEEDPSLASTRPNAGSADVQSGPLRVRRNRTGQECVLTIPWGPAHGVQVEVAVMEEKLVIRALARPLKQGHEVSSIDDPVGRSGWH